MRNQISSEILAVVLRVFGEIHRRHPSRAELALEAIAAGEGGGEACERVRVLRRANFRLGRLHNRTLRE
jgi:hypothetical protein